MLHRKGLVRAAAFAALACTGICRADANGSPSDDGLSLRPAFLDAPATAPAPPPSTAPAPIPNPLMLLLEHTPIGKPLEDAGIKINGYVEGGYTHSSNTAPGNVLTGGVFDTKGKRVVLDQLDLAIDRPVDYAGAATKHTFDIGGHFEAVYGWDTGIVHSLGLYDNPATLGAVPGHTYYSSRTQPENQFDIEQAYLDFALPVGSGLRIRAGKFVTLLGQEVINPTQDALYSHSYLFGYAIPFTQTGIMGEYVLSPDLMLDAGVTRGWNQSVRDSNGDPDFLGALTFTPQESDALKKWKIVGNLSMGPQAAHDNHDWWTVIDLIAAYTASDKLTLTLNADYGDAPHAIGGVTSAQWFGAALYASYVVNQFATFNARGEWYDDNNGFTFGVPGNLSVYEATFGMAIKVFPDDPVMQNLVIRPEIRFDYASKDFFDSGHNHFQAEFGVDAYFAF